jgi:DNA-binding response OmpR family regulator
LLTEVNTTPPALGSNQSVHEILADGAVIGYTERSILVVDDEPHFLTLMSHVLSKEGFRVTTASAGVDALIEVDTRQFCAAILDVKMHPRSGIEVLAKIKKRQPAMRVIMATGYPTEAGKNQCLELGAAAYLTKPLDLVEVKALLRTLTAIDTGST